MQLSLKRLCTDYMGEDMLSQKHGLSIIILMLSLSACSTNKYLVQSAGAETLIDGNQIEWSGRFQIPKGEAFAVALSSNSNYVYLALTSMDKNFQRKLSTGGLTLWLDAKGGKRQNMGIKYEGIAPRDRRQGKIESNQDRRSSPDSEDGLWGYMPFPNGDMNLIVINEKGRERLGPSDLLATAHSEGGQLFIEYQIPLVLLPADFNSSKLLGLGIESVFDRPDRTNGSQDAMSRGGRGAMQGGRAEGPMGGSGRSQGGRRPGSGNRAVQDDLEVWLKLQFNE